MYPARSASPPRLHRQSGFIVGGSSEADPPAMKFALLAVLCALSRAAADPDCSSFDSCSDCTTHSTWFPGSHCRWCTEGAGSCHAEASLINPCTIFSSHKNVVDPEDCASPPTPSPAPLPPAPPLPKWAVAVLKVLLKAKNVTGVDIDTCVSDVGRSYVMFSEFAADFEAKRYEPDAAQALGRGLNALAAAATDCKIKSLQAELAVLAAAARDADFSAAVWVDAAALAKAIAAGDTTAVGTALAGLMGAWRAVTQGCLSGNKACQFLDRLLALLSLGAEDVAPCEAALVPAFQHFTSSATAFQAHQYESAVTLFADGLDDVANAVTADSCGLKGLGQLLGAFSPRLRAAVVKIESSSIVHIIVGSVDVYEPLFSAANDIKNGNLADLGVQIGRLVAMLRASSCTTAACDVLEGLLRALQLGVSDYKACAADVDAIWPSLSSAVAHLEAGEWKAAAQSTGAALSTLAASASACGVQPLGEILEDTAMHLNRTGVAEEIGTVVMVLTEGADLTLDLKQLLADGKAGAWTSFGSDLGTLASWLKNTGCTSFACTMLEGLLDAAAIPFGSLTACVADIRTAETSLAAGAKSFHDRNYATALKYWGSGLHQIANSVGDCHLADELSFVSREAQVLGFGKVAADAGAVAQVLVHGADFYNELYDAFVAIEGHDYRSAGADLGKVMNTLSSWTTSHACTSDFCYVVLGIFQFMGDIQGDIRQCKTDFKLAFTNFSAAFTELHDVTEGKYYGKYSVGDFAFSTRASQIKQGVRDLGYGLLDVSHGVKDCHLEELAEILEELAVKLGIAPDVQFIEDVLKILIDGVEIEQEIGSACLDYSEGNWVGFGYNLAKLVKTLIGDAASVALERPAITAA
ncbi:hypothetical protein AB1Y20_019115 [Prymnesium parvum]|uniref:Uncharacterized protein n=1 Tax=Prymnesium parvum TaxID=97485 RepID=A0AB34JTQ5_PRYPA